jgi:sterol desaturase/sphingolipid hydroxylase (fatty acid hydroxylase superfamily)
MFIGLNKLATAPFVYFFLRYSYFEPNIVWDLDQITLVRHLYFYGIVATNYQASSYLSSPLRLSINPQTNTLLPLPAMFIVYDFFYTILHWSLHIKAIYGFIHKHHHHQKAPR